jgi:hypothetical protein
MSVGSAKLALAKTGALRILNEGVKAAATAKTPSDETASNTMVATIFFQLIKQFMFLSP